MTSQDVGMHFLKASRQPQTHGGLGLRAEWLVPGRWHLVIIASMLATANVMDSIGLSIIKGGHSVLYRDYITEPTGILETGMSTMHHFQAHERML